MHINGILFIQILQLISSKNMEEIKRAIKELHQFYETNNFKTTTIYYDTKFHTAPKLFTILHKVKIVSPLPWAHVSQA